MTFATQLAASFSPIAATYDSSSVSRALAWAQSFIESYCDRTFDQVADDIVYIDPKPYRQALLPGIPVTAVSAVSALLPPTSGTGGLTWTVLTNYRFVADTGLIYDTTGESGTSWDVGPSWPYVPGGLKVTYTHGYSTVPQALVDTGCRMAQQYLENPALSMQRKVGDDEARYAGVSGVALNDLDQRILDRYTDIGIV